jgi:hypothetical protein
VSPLLIFFYWTLQPKLCRTYVALCYRCNSIHGEQIADYGAATSYIRLAAYHCCLLKKQTIFKRSNILAVYVSKRSHPKINSCRRKSFNLQVQYKNVYISHDSSSTRRCTLDTAINTVTSTITEWYKNLNQPKYHVCPKLTPDRDHFNEKKKKPLRKTLKHFKLQGTNPK